MSEPAIIVDGLSKSYRIGHQAEKYPTFREAVVRSLTGPIRRFRQLQAGGIGNGDNEETFWALKDVSFEVQPGEVVGIIGRNGAGKSTLLKILSRITEPTSGQAILNGRAASLLEVGTGFHPELTGRENIYLNGAILGMKRAEIDRKFDEIVAFSEIEKFLDTPVKRYSSGMYVRLAFAVAAHLEPEVLIVDEVLAVGDAEFQARCLGKMREVACGQGRTVLFVSHNMSAVQTLCSRAILLKEGSVEVDVDAYSAVSTYLQRLEFMQRCDLTERTDRRGKGVLRLTRIRVTGADGLSRPSTGRDAVFSFGFTGKSAKPSVQFTIYSMHGQPLVTFDSENSSSADTYCLAPSGQFVCYLSPLLLVPGRYRLNVALRADGELQDHVEGAALFDAEPGSVGGRSANHDDGYGSVTIPHTWKKVYMGA